MADSLRPVSTSGKDAAVESPYTVDDAVLVRETDVMRLYRVGAREVRVPILHVLPETTAHTVGRPGKLVVPKWVAIDLNLYPSAS